MNFVFEPNLDPLCDLRREYLEVLAVIVVDVGGLDKTIAYIRELVAVRQNSADMFEQAGPPPVTE
jgi:ATP-dependent 26S proteasome regulatory subunit